MKAYRVRKSRKVDIVHRTFACILISPATHGWFWNEYERTAGNRVDVLNGLGLFAVSISVNPKYIYIYICSVYLCKSDAFR